MSAVGIQDVDIQPEGRIDPITGAEVIIAPRRGLNPEKYVNDWVARDAVPEHNRQCPFCPGNEATQNEAVLERLEEERDSSSWIRRCVTNRYPFLSDQLAGEEFSQNLVYGVQEVLIGARAHNKFFSRLTIAEIAGIFGDVVERYFARRSASWQKVERRLRWFSVFKNYGLIAGASQEHSHLQLIWKSKIPASVREEYFRILTYWWERWRCLVYDEIERHRKWQLVIAETPRFVLFVPYAVCVPYHFRICPTAHAPSFAHVLKDQEALCEFASLVKKTVLAFKQCGAGS